MKCLLPIILGLFVLCGCGAADKSKDGGQMSGVKKQPVMRFAEESVDFGVVKQGEKVVLFYTFENAGSADLVIYEALPSCGCATAKYDNTPVKPGEKRTVGEYTKNWDVDRIAYMDILILVEAIAELIDFKDIPVNITLNEYIDIAKYYSTPNSSVLS